MSWEKYSFNNYLYNELTFWKSIKAVYFDKEIKNERLGKLVNRFKEENILDWAEKRYNSFMTLLKLFKDKYKKKFAELVKEKLGMELSEIDTFEKFKQKTGKESWSWTEKAIMICIFAIEVVTQAAITVDSIGPEALASALTEEDNYLTCEEIEELWYWSWLEYLLMVRRDRAEYIYALACANCHSLKLLLESFNYNHELILPEDSGVVEYFFYAARLIECGLI